ncbi:4Fe-4S dicluster domain-containing protein [Muricoccus pecuniae]|uniref:Ferredoxin n=1 Tax=Muricoccus pecuniae TaxID=693023 RepID=A0A840YN94_9PROT|nr:4Fe-4S dicluster domain-containing protein [Roseomonas pecuniae]MBB5696374.1 ferredoxin [Roseomonas pecuniae]
MTCRDACEPGAIRFSLAIGGARPRVEAGICTGCGECVPGCPASAISIVPRPMEETADA